MLNQKIQEGKKLVTVGGTYVHYKAIDQPNNVITLGILEATEEQCVVYQALYGNKLTWVRTLADWTMEVTDEKGLIVPRFKQIPQ